MEQGLEILAPEVQLSGAFTCTAAPVQAEGSIASRAFYFRSRHSTWSFAAAPTKDVDPVDIFSAAQGFFREGTFGVGEHDASYVPHEEARRLIVACAGEFLRSMCNAAPYGDTAG